MNAKLKILFAFVAISFISILSAKAQTIALSPHYDEEEPIFNEIPSRGHRIPSKCILCSIDWNNKSFVFNSDISEEITGYELWSEDGLQISSFEASSIIDFLAENAGVTLKIVIKTPARRWVGYYINEP